MLGVTWDKVVGGGGGVGGKGLYLTEKNPLSMMKGICWSPDRPGWN